MFNDAAFRERLQPDGRQLDQLGTGDGPDRLLRDHRPGAARTDHGVRADRATSATSSPAGSPSEWARRSPTSSSRPTPTTSSPASSTTATCRSVRSSPTTSPSMDIQVSSNFERLLFEMNERDGLRTAEQLARFRQSGRLELPAELPRAVDRRVTSAPHGSTTTRSLPRCAACTTRPACSSTRTPPPGRPQRAARQLAGDHPVVTMATAHPAKFPDAVEHATGVRPALPAHLADLLERPERTETLPNDLAAVEEFVPSAFGDVEPRPPALIATGRPSPVIRPEPPSADVDRCRPDRQRRTGANDTDVSERFAIGAGARYRERAAWNPRQNSFHSLRRLPRPACRAIGVGCRTSDVLSSTVGRWRRGIPNPHIGQRSSAPRQPRRTRPRPDLDTAQTP